MKKLILANIMLLVLIFGLQTGYAGATVTLSTTLLTVDNRSRSATVTAANQSDTAQRYRVSVIDMVMDSNGNVSRVSKDTPTNSYSASSWVIATPSSLRLEPGESQTIRLLIRRPKDLKAGEYRAHLLVSQEPPADIAGGLKEETPEKGMLSFNLVTVYATSIPIIIQHGQISVSASIKEVHLNDRGKMVFKIKREGNASFRGFVTAQAVDTKKTIYLPITLYEDVESITRSYDIGELAQSEGPITINLYKGIIPREGESLPVDIIQTLTVSR